MKTGDLVISPTFGITGIVVSFLDFGYKLHSYRGTVKILKGDGGMITLDVHTDDEWKVIS